MKFSQDYTSNIIQHAELFSKKYSCEPKVLMHIHCCLRLSMQSNCNKTINETLQHVFTNNFPIIIDMDKLKDNYASITQSNPLKSVDNIFITEDNKIIFVEYKFNKISVSKIFDTLENKIKDSESILKPLSENNIYTIHNKAYVIYNDDQIENVKNIYRNKLDELNPTEQDNIYTKCCPYSIKDLYKSFFNKP